ncbi:MAG: hypothetical protein SOV59_08340 [Fusobacterium mortiferum]|nr:hypothetical protein [Fusobacterium mortiferum]
MKLSSFYQRVNNLGVILNIEKENIIKMKANELIPLLKEKNIKL